MASTLFRLMSRWVDNISWVMEAMGLHQFMPANWLTEWLASKVLKCVHNTAQHYRCATSTCTVKQSARIFSSSSPATTHMR